MAQLAAVPTVFQAAWYAVGPIRVVVIGAMTLGTYVNLVLLGRPVTFTTVTRDSGVCHHGNDVQTMFVVSSFRAARPPSSRLLVAQRLLRQWQRRVQ